MDINKTIGKNFKGIAHASQGAVERLTKQWSDKVSTSLGKVLATHPDRMTCDVITSNGYTATNIPILTECGLEAEEVWGTLSLPSVDSTVIIGFIEGRESFPFIMGTIFPYAYDKYQSGQTPVKSKNKTTVVKLLEDIDAKVYRKVFKSGTTIEVDSDGTIQVETPSGTLLKIDESNSGAVNLTVVGNVNIADGNGNVIEMGSSSVTINGNLEVLQ